MFKTNDMKIRNRKLFITFCFIVLITACSNEPKIKSVTEDKVVVGAPAEQFLGAYDLAKKECEKNTKTAHYIPDDNIDLEVVSFNCIGQEEEVVAETEADTEAEADASMEEEIPEEALIEQEADEELPAETLMEETDLEMKLDAGEESTE